MMVQPLAWSDYEAAVTRLGPHALPALPPSPLVSCSQSVEQTAADTQEAVRAAAAAVAAREASVAAREDELEARRLRHEERQQRQQGVQQQVRRAAGQGGDPAGA